MQSSLRVWSLHRNVLLSACACIVSTALESAAAEADTTPSEPATSAERPSSDISDPEHRVILLVRTNGDEDTIARLRFELAEGSFRILELQPDAGLENEPLSAAAAREHVAAAVRVDAARGRVELWVRDERGSIEETFTAGSEGSQSHVLAVRVAETLRARGLLVPPAPKPAAPWAEQPVVPAPATTTPAPSPAPAAAHGGTRFSIELGAGLVASPGGLGPFGAVELGLRLEFLRLWSISALGALPISRQSVEAAEGEAVTSSSVAGALLELEWARLPFGGFRSGLGAGVTLTNMSGRGASGFSGADDTVVAFTPLLRTSFHLDLGPRLRLRTGVAGGFTLPEVKVAFGSREVASWGRPFGLLSLALEASPL